MISAAGFNSDFYVVIATIVPIFMLAMTVSAFRGIGLPRVMAWSIDRNGDPKLRRVLVLVTLAMIPFAVAIFAEGGVLDALASRRNLNPAVNVALLVAIYVLMAISVVGIMLPVLEGLLGEHLQRERAIEEP